MAVPFTDLTAANASVLDEFIEEVRGLFASGQFVQGPAVQKFEDTFARFIGNRHCVTVGNGSDALALALRVLGAAPGDEVICPAYGFPSTAQAVARLGARPVFVDCRPDTYTLDPDQTLSAITAATKAIIPMHVHGMAAEIDRMVTVARTYSISVIEDTRNGTGGRNNSRRLGTYGEFGVFSFHPANPLGAAGDGGALTCNDDEKANQLRKLREHGAVHGKGNECIGYNTRLDSIHAALLQLKLQDLDENNAECIENAGLYQRLFFGSPVHTPAYSDAGNHVYSAYTVLVPDREKLMEHLHEKNIGFQVYCPTPIHLLPCFHYLGYRDGAFPIAEDLARRSISLPIW
ncbi:DegT/DnrJ/EryC1/StrS family aminotransferase, partial [Candidatus Poribacteria bacterium]|nr:DegT/DnrJ/EryC1/StrS family aminotransferase [Candidatus Poribacteria bacterium]